MKIVVGSDHCGYSLKIKMLSYFEELGYEVVDVGCYSEDPLDFPDVTKKACEKILTSDCERGIMFCGTGIGAAIAGNKMKGIRAAVCHDFFSAHQAVEHDNVNMMCIGAKVVGEWITKDLIYSFINAKFSTEEAYQRRVRKLEQMEGKI